MKLETEDICIDKTEGKEGTIVPKHARPPNIMSKYKSLCTTLKMPINIWLFSFENRFVQVIFNMGKF